MRFWIASLARIYPMYIVSVLLDVPQLLLFRIAKFGVMTGSAGLAFTLAAHATMLQSWWPSLGGLNFPTWSLSTEAFFYFAFPFLIVLLGRVKAIVPLLFVLGATWVVSLIVPLIVAPTDPSPSTFVQHLIGRNPLLRLPDFVAGIFLAQLHRRLTTSAPPANARVLSAGLVVAGAAAFAGALGLTNVFGFLPFHNGLLMPVYCAIILGLALSPADSVVSAVFATRLPILLGEASYSLYLLHIPLWLDSRPSCRRRICRDMRSISRCSSSSASRRSSSSNCRCSCEFLAGTTPEAPAEAARYRSSTIADTSRP